MHSLNFSIDLRNCPSIPIFWANLIKGINSSFLQFRKLLKIFRNLFLLLLHNLLSLINFHLDFHQLLLIIFNSKFIVILYRFRQTLEILFQTLFILIFQVQLDGLWVHNLLVFVDTGLESIFLLISFGDLVVSNKHWSLEWFELLDFGGWEIMVFFCFEFYFFVVMGYLFYVDETILI